jgi:hypothetical protein
MQRISRREQILIKVGVLLAIVLTLWFLGLLGNGPVILS